MEVVTGAMSTLLPKLSDLLKEEYKLQKGVRGEIMFLKAELESMQAALLKVSKAPIDQPPDIQVKLWARDVKELSYDIEDSIDKFMVHIDTTVPTKPHRFRGFIDRCLNLLTKGHVRHKIGTNIKDIKSRIKEVSERRDRYMVDNVVAKPVGQSIDSLRQLALYKKAIELVGTEEKSDGLIKRLMEGDEASKQQLRIVSIVGFGGLGKTTLANIVYQKLKVQFDCGAFVAVSLNPDMKVIMKKMLHQLGKSINEATWDETQLISELREFLQDKRSGRLPGWPSHEQDDIHKHDRRFRSKKNNLSDFCFSSGCQLIHLGVESEAKSITSMEISTKQNRSKRPSQNRTKEQQVLRESEQQRRKEPK